MKSISGLPASETPDTAHTACHDEGAGAGDDPWSAIEAPVRDLGLEKPKVDIAFIPILCCAPLLYAKTHGYFAKNGLDATLTPSPGWSGVKDLLGFGHTDAAHLLSPMPLAIREGLDGRRVDIRLGCIQNVNGQALTLARRHAGITNVREMKGFTFGVPYRFSMHYYLLCQFLAERGIDPLRDVNIIEVSPPRMPHSIDTGQVDGVFAPEPFNQIPVSRGTGFIYTLSKELWHGHPCCCFACTEEFISKHPRTYRAMLKSVLEAELFLHRASPGERRQVATELCQPSILNQLDPEPVAQALSGEYDDGAGRHCIEHDRIDFLPTPWPEYGQWILTQQQRWNQLCRRVDYREVVEACFDATTRAAAMALGFEESGPNLKGVKAFGPAGLFDSMQSQPFCAFTVKGESEHASLDQRIDRLSSLLAAAAGGRETPNVEAQADDAFGGLEQLAGDLLKNIGFAQDALREQKETLECTVRDRIAEIDQHRRNAVGIAEEAERAKQAAEASRARYEEVVAMISDVVWRYELDGEGWLVECYISPVADRLLGLPEGTIGNNMETYFSYVEPEDLPNVRETLASGLRNLVREAAVDYRLRKPGGATLWVRSKGSAYLQANGHVLGFGTTSDITDRKRAEEALKKNEAMLSCILNSIPLSIFWKDRESVYLGCNETFAGGANLRPEKVVGRTDYELPWSLEDTEAYRADDREVMVSGRARMHITEQQHHPDGSCIWLDTTKIPLLDAEGSVYGVLGIYDDVTERKQMEDDLRDAKDAADAANLAKSQFLANMSHEIRTPMTAILGYADLILDEEAKPTTRQYVAVIKRNGEHLMELISEILDLSKIESGNLQIELTRCSPVDLVAGVATLMRHQAAAKNLQFTTELSDHLPETVLTDPLRLRQVLVNLVGNAIKFTNHGGVRLAVRLGFDGDRAHLCFDVTDTGIGMSREQLGKLFMPFSQVDSSSTRKFGGTGLGLCISKRLAESLGGGIAVQSAPGEGSTFTVTIDPEPVEGRPAVADAGHGRL